MNAAPAQAPFVLPDLPYPATALEPYVSASTLGFHHGKHHATYVTKLNKLVEGTNMANVSLEEVILESHKGSMTGIFNNSAQVWNHTFFWNCMVPKGGGQPDSKSNLAQQIVKEFGSHEKFVEKFKDTAVNTFGSGWAWLVLDKQELKVVSTKDADNPLTKGQAPLLTVDVWEHAYYLDYQNRRPDFVSAFTDHLINWKFVEDNYNKAITKH